MNTHAIGKRIKLLRKEKKYTQEDLAGLIGVKRVTISKYESGEVLPPLMKIRSLSDALSCPPGYLLGTQERLVDESAARMLEKMYGLEQGALQELTKPYTAEEVAKIKLEKLEMEKYEIQFRSLMLQLSDSGREEAMKRLEELTIIPRYRNDTKNTGGVEDG